MEKNNYHPGSTTYPGIEIDEIFLENISATHITEDDGSMSAKIRDSEAFEKNFKEIPYKTKRAGDQAYSPTGELLTNFRPIFIKKTESKKKE